MAESDLKGECFVIAPIGEPGGAVRKRTEKVFKFIVSEAVKGKYKPILAHEIEEPGKITFHIIERLVTSEVVIADLTDQNANVYYELALRHALNLPAILIIKEDQLDNIPFDIKDLRVIPYELDVEKAEITAEQISQQIVFVEREPGHASNIISEEVVLVPEPKGEDQVLLGVLLIANRYRYELIEPYFDMLVPIEVRNRNLQSVFRSVMTEAAQKEYMRPSMVKSVFSGDSRRSTLLQLFEEMETILPAFGDALKRADEEDIKAQLRMWRSNNTRFLRVWAEQFSEWVKGLDS